MRQQEAKTRILAEWQALPKIERTSELQAAAFAIRILPKYPFRYSGDRCERIKTWLLFSGSKVDLHNRLAKETRRVRRRPSS
jgi:hypothetical protein